MVFREINRCDVAADIGTDHAYIPIALIQNNIAKKVIAADISKGSCDKAEANVSFYKLNDCIDVRCGSGLTVINSDEKLDSILISGMGGLLMIEVLKSNVNAVENAKQLVLQPQKDIDKVRRYIHSIGFKICNEEITFEGGKYYIVINAVKGFEQYTAVEYMFGKKLIEKNSEIFLEYINQEYNKAVRNLNRASESVGGNSAIVRINALKEEIKMYEEVKNVSKM
jgi:tRNA (adenine22-N1)-methyltransferase